MVKQNIITAELMNTENNNEPEQTTKMPTVTPKMTKKHEKLYQNGITTNHPKHDQLQKQNKNMKSKKWYT